MFLGAFLPGLVLVGLYMLFIMGFAILNPKSAPAVHYGGKFDRDFLVKVVLTLFALYLFYTTSSERSRCSR